MSAIYPVRPLAVKRVGLGVEACRSAASSTGQRFRERESLGLQPAAELRGRDRQCDGGRPLLGYGAVLAPQNYTLTPLFRDVWYSRASSCVEKVEHDITRGEVFQRMARSGFSEDVPATYLEVVS